MDILEDLVITLRKQICIPNWSESEIREFVAALEISPREDNTFFVTSNGARVMFVIGADGNFAGAFMQVGGIQVPIIFGTNSPALQVFKGNPTATNPGPGWMVEVDLTRRYLSQSGPEPTWEIFFASRVGVINTFSSEIP